jgi:hypothetical protein
MSSTRIYTDTPPFWRRFGFFFHYIRQEKLFFQVTLLAFLNLLLVIPSFIIQIMIQISLFLASYKLAFEVLNNLSRGEFQYRDSFSHQISEVIGFKALGMPVLQLLLFIFVFRYDPTTGAALLFLTTLLTPAFLMILAESQSLINALNPLTQVQIATRIGGEYIVLTLFFIVLSGLNLLARYLFNGVLPALIEMVFLAWLLYFLLVFSFSVIGYVMYRHADSIGHETKDHEEDRLSKNSTQSSGLDPFKQRIEDLLKAGDGQQALSIINEISEKEQREDLNLYRLDAQHLAKRQQTVAPAERLHELVKTKQNRQAMQLYKEHHARCYLIRPAHVSDVNPLIKYNLQNNNHGWVIRLYKLTARNFPKNHQDIVDNGHIAAQSLYQLKQADKARRLLQRLIRQYQQTADVRQLKSYLIGLQKRQKKPTT